MVPEEKVAHPEFNAPKSQPLHRFPKPWEILARKRKSLWAVSGIIAILLVVIVGLWVRLGTKHSTGSSRYLAFSSFRTDGRVTKHGDTSIDSTLTPISESSMRAAAEPLDHHENPGSKSHRTLVGRGSICSPGASRIPEKNIREFTWPQIMHCRWQLPRHLSAFEMLELGPQSAKIGPVL